MRMLIFHKTGIDILNVFGSIFTIFVLVNFLTMSLVYLQIENEATCNDSLIQVKNIFFDFPKMYGDLCSTDETLLIMMLVFGIISILMMLNKHERGWT